MSAAVAVFMAGGDVAMPDASPDRNNVGFSSANRMFNLSGKDVTIRPIDLKPRWMPPSRQ